MKLIIEDDEGRRTLVPFVGEALTVGRLEGNHVLLSEKNVSRRHARIYRNKDGKFFVEDLDSFTGIRVNGDRITKKRLVQEGDLIQISEYDLSLQESPDERKKREGAQPVASEDDEPTQPSARAPAGAAEDETRTSPSRPPVARVEAATLETPPLDAATQQAQADEAEARRKAAVTSVIRLADLPEQMNIAEDRALAESERPRLVGLTGALRGKEWTLARTPASIGRAAENDVSIDHPSVSRVHAKLGLSGGTWKVIDAESRNGLLIDGDPYAASPLLGGETLELGHLKFAFVAPGQAFTLPTDMTPGPRLAQRMAPLKAVSAQPRAGASPVGLVAGGAIVAVLVAAGVLYVLHGREPQDPKAPQLETPRHAAALDAKAHLVRSAALAAPAPASAAATKAASIAAAPIAGATARAAAADVAAAPRSPPAVAVAPSSIASPAAPAPAAPAATAAPAPSADDREARRLLAEGNQKLIAQDFAGALATFESVIALKPADGVLGPAYRSMGIAYTRQGNIAEGARYYRLYLPLCTVPREREYLTRTLAQYDATQHPAEAPAR